MNTTTNLISNCGLFNTTSSTSYPSFLNYPNNFNGSLFYGDGSAFINSILNSPTVYQLHYNQETEKDGSILIELSVPKYSKEDIKISIEKKSIIFKSVIKEETFWKKSFEKSFYIGSDINQTKIKAKLEQGVLQVRIPLKEEFKPQEITID